MNEDRADPGASLAPLSLFAGIGIEIEYMVVDRESLDPVPAVERLLRAEDGSVVNSLAHGPTAWSNELTAHVFELKAAAPVRAPDALHAEIVASLAEAEARLAQYGCRLLPGAMHPWLDPKTETALWAHDDAEIYAAFDRIFDTSGHGWRNLQSVHLNLPFVGDEEFRRLHSAIRLVLPLIPGLAAASPYADGARGPALDTRLLHYRAHSAAVPETLGLVVPDVMTGAADYRRLVYAPLARAMRDLDPEGVLDPIWLNARGCIARFDRGAIEIRLIDSQECPRADLAIAALVGATVRALVEERFGDLAEQEAVRTPLLRRILDQSIETADDAVVSDRTYLDCLGWSLPGSATIGEVWRHLAAECEGDPWLPAATRSDLATLLDLGPLARRLRAAAGDGPSRERLRAVYRRVADCLRADAWFEAAPG